METLGVCRCSKHAKQVVTIMLSHHATVRGLVEFTPISPFLAEEHPKSAPNLTALPDPNGTTAAAELCGTVKVSSKSAHGVARNVFFGCREQAGASAEVATAASPT